MTTPVIYLPPTADRPAEPAPFLLTAEDMARLLRMEDGNARKTLARYRREGQLRGTQIGKKVRYTLPEAIRFLEKATEQNPR